MAWKCIRCRTEIDADQAEPDIDDFGLHFMCPVCGRRNRLVGRGEEGGLLVLEQPDEGSRPEC